MTDFEGARRRMVDNQLRTSNVTDRRLLAALGSVPRERFVPKARAALAYLDAVQPIGGGRLLAAPAPFARLLQLAAIAQTDRVLVVGCGSGYSAAVVAQLGAEVTAIESDPALCAEARANLAALGLQNVKVVEAGFDGRDAPRGPFDVVVVEGAVDRVPPAFLEALADGGRLVAAISGRGPAVAHVFVRSGGEVSGRAEFDSALPPLPAAATRDAFVF